MALRRAELRQKTSAPASGGAAGLGRCGLDERPLIDLTGYPTLLRTEPSGQVNANSRVMPERR